VQRISGGQPAPCRATVRRARPSRTRRSEGRRKAVPHGRMSFSVPREPLARLVELTLDVQARRAGLGPQVEKVVGASDGGRALCHASDRPSGPALMPRRACPRRGRPSRYAREAGVPPRRQGDARVGRAGGLMAGDALAPASSARASVIRSSLGALNLVQFKSGSSIDQRTRIRSNPRASISAAHAPGMDEHGHWCAPTGDCRIASRGRESSSAEGSSRQPDIVRSSARWRAGRSLSRAR
jgi:hypothetical protein